MRDDIEEVFSTNKEEEANAWLDNGWVLLQGGIDANGWPLYVLGRPRKCSNCAGSGSILGTKVDENENFSWGYSPCPVCCG